MGLSSALDWWDEWKLRILVLCSLLVQFFLFFADYVRRFYALRRLKVLVWLAYIGGDALAIYALATLFNREKQQTTVDGGSNYAIEVVWAPVLLIHLGGQSISAYSLEDNELWKRHVITLVFQVTVALYVFCKWWSGEKRLLQAAVLLFIVGIIKFGQKPWALRRASYGSITSTSTYLSSLLQRAEEESSSWWCRLGVVCTVVCTCTDITDFLAEVEEKRRGGVGKKRTNYSLEEYVKEAQEHVKHGPMTSVETQREKFKNDEELILKDTRKMFLDLAAPYSVRLHFLQSFLNLGGENQHAVLSRWIDLQFLAIYSKLRSVVTCLGVCTVFLLPSLPLASVVLFAMSDKDGYNKRDITVTYILFLGAVVLELAPLFFMFLESLPGRSLLSYGWQDMVSQHNIMSFCVRKKKPPTLMKLAATFSYLLRDYINKHWYIWHEPAAQQISMLVCQHVEDGWIKYIQDAATYRRFNNLRGERTLMKMSHHLLDQGKLGWTFHWPFDEYVLLWHISTDLCLHHTSSSTNNTTTASSSQSQDTIKSHRSNSEIISNNMIYLLFICPEMLIPGARQDLFIHACDDIERIIKDEPLPSLDKRRIAQRIFVAMGQDGNEPMRESGVVSNAYKLAKVLIDLDNDTRMWEVIQGVWVEMLCYSASRCRGYLHAKSLGVAGEFLTNVWLLWWCMGMQTLPDMMNNLGPPEEQTAAAASV